MSKGSGKGGKGPIGGCWHCGGKHYAVDFPKGKGKGKLGLFEASESDWDSAEEGSLKYLSSLTLKGRHFEHPIIGLVSRWRRIQLNLWVLPGGPALLQAVQVLSVGHRWEQELNLWVSPGRLALR